jgi:2-polyprenyl-3-methyl-5-hydroxy-6-metoxy-1,4-benzoquinol methylase
VTRQVPLAVGERQAALYSFPYHHLAHVDEDGGVRCGRVIGWGLEYMCYVLHIRDLVRELRPSSLLEVGCGDGRVIGLLDEVAQRTGVDLDARAVGFARAFHPAIEFHVLDAGELRGTFDLVLAVEVLEHVPDEGVTSFLRSLSARARPGGHVIISVPTTVIPLNPKHHRHYDRNLLERQVAASGAALRLKRVEYVYRDTRRTRLYRRLISNRLWAGDIHLLRGPAWRHVWNVARHGDSSNGKHLVSVWERT